MAETVNSVREVKGGERTPKRVIVQESKKRKLNEDAIKPAWAIQVIAKCDISKTSTIGVLTLYWCFLSLLESLLLLLWRLTHLL